VGPQGARALFSKLIKLNQVVQGYFFLRVVLFLGLLGAGIVVVF